MKNIVAFVLNLVIFLGLSVQTIQAQQMEFIKGADGSVLDEVEQSGGKYYDNGVEKDALTIFKEHGFNTIRLKLWHTPVNQFNSLPNVMATAKRAKEKGFRFLLDIHYSDTWADPGHQTKPAAWEGLSFDVLSDSVYEYTKHVISLLKAQHTLPDYVQTGNEISCGMLWNDGRICGEFVNEAQWQKFTTLVKKGIQGVHDALDEGEKVNTIIHFDNGANNTGSQWFFTNLINHGVDFDIIGLSYYPWWHGTLTELKDNLNDLSTRYQKDIILVESGYPWTLAWSDNTNNIVGSEDQLLPGYPATVEGQKAFLKEVLRIVKSTPEGRGKGFVYWSPEWIPDHPGSPWENVALFDFEGEVLESMRVFEDQTSIGEYPVGQYLADISCFPNPFAVKTTISFTVNRTGDVEVSIVDSLGGEVFIRKMKGLLPGKHTLVWQPDNLAPGVYQCIMAAGSKTFPLKIILLK